MKETGLIFNQVLIAPTMAELKTQTRRNKGLERVNNNADYPKDAWEYEGVKLVCGYNKKKQYFEYNAHFFANIHKRKSNKDFGLSIKCPFGDVGDLLYVKETYGEATHNKFYENERLMFYKADYDDAKNLSLRGAHRFTYKSPMFMPKEAARIWMILEDVRAERLLDISEADAIAEGVKSYEKNRKTFYIDYMDDAAKWSYATPSFFSLIDYVTKRKKGAPSITYQNPWVWVLKFKLLSTTGRADALKNLQTINSKI